MSCVQTCVYPKIRQTKHPLIYFSDTSGDQEMSQELNNFFAKITADEALQKRLYATKEIANVATIAKEMGF